MRFEGECYVYNSENVRKTAGFSQDPGYTKLYLERTVDSTGKYGGRKVGF